MIFDSDLLCGRCQHPKELGVPGGRGLSKQKCLEYILASGLNTKKEKYWNLRAEIIVPILAEEANQPPSLHAATFVQFRPELDASCCRLHLTRWKLI